MIEIRKTQSDDWQDIQELVKEAFNEKDEARIVHKLETTGAASISLVALQDEKIVGYILYTPVSLDTSPHRFFLGLAPIAVHPDCQKQGIGSKLIHKSLEIATLNHALAVFVLGDPVFYSRFGFTSSQEYDISSEFEVDAQYFMALELQQECLQPLNGVIEYLPDFSAL